MTLVSVYADGSSCGRKKGPGGWGFVIARGSEVLEMGAGGWPQATNNQMESLAAIEGLRACVKYIQDPGTRVELVSDSQYVLGLASGAYEAVKNLELATELRALYVAVAAGQRWVRGHSGDVFNEICDKLAKYGKGLQTAVEEI